MKKPMLGYKKAGSSKEFPPGYYKFTKTEGEMQVAHYGSLKRFKIY
jgi:hypothetical protein